MCSHSNSRTLIGSLSEAVYWDRLGAITKQRSLSFPHYTLPEVPPMALCYSKKREADKYKVHEDCPASDECKVCTFSSEAVVQAYWRLQMLPMLQPNMLSSTLVDRHTHASLPPSFFTNELAPDIVLYDAGMPKIDLYIISVGEIKFSGNLTAEHCGQLAKYVQVLFDIHPHRQRLYAWLATETKIRLFKFEADGSRNIASVETSQDFGYSDGLSCLCSMLRLDFAELGLLKQPIPMPHAPGVGLVPTRYLGRGTFATAYAAAKPAGDDTVVIKLFRGDASGARALLCEQEILQHLEECKVQGITKLVGRVAYQPGAPAIQATPAPAVLVLEPEGVTLDRVVRNRQRDTNYRLTCMPLVLSASHRTDEEHLPVEAVCKLLVIIQNVHEVGRVVHCDLSLSNMYFVHDGRVRPLGSGGSCLLRLTERDRCL